MPELGAWICFCVNAGNLNELLCSKVSHCACDTFAQYEKIVLIFKELSNVFVLLNKLRLKGVLKSQRQASYIADYLLSLTDYQILLLHAFNFLLRFLVWEPQSYKGDANHLGDETFDVAVAVAWLLVKTDVFLDELRTKFLIFIALIVEHLFLLWLSFFLNLIYDLCDWWVFYIHNVEACEVVLVSQFDSF